MLKKQRYLTDSKAALMHAVLQKKWTPQWCPLLAILGSPTWTRTRDLRINSLNNPLI
jgi:hypothetical protein